MVVVCCHGGVYLYHSYSFISTVPISLDIILRFVNENAHKR